MARARVKRLPVVDETGMLEGVVSRADLLKVFLRDDQEIEEEVRREIVARLFPPSDSSVELRVEDGVVTVIGRIRDTSLVPVAARLVRAVEGSWTCASTWRPVSGRRRRDILGMRAGLGKWGRSALVRAGAVRR